MDRPRFASALATGGDVARDLDALAADLREGLDGAEPDLLVLFATPDHGPEQEGLGPGLGERMGARHVLGCTGGSVLEGAREVERGSGLAAWAAHLPGARLTPFRLRARQDPEGWAVEGLPACDDPSQAGVLLLGDPFSLPAPAVLERLARDLPGTPVVGGLASGGRAPGQNTLWLDDQAHALGGVGLLLEGDVELLPVVSQGCRPVGEPLVITACRDNLLLELRGKPAAQVLGELLQGLPQGDRERFRHGAFVGLAVDPTKSTFSASDLLVRQVLGLLPQERAVAVGASGLRRGSTVQFMVRDAASASEELTRVLREGPARWLEGTPVEERGALLFTCGGRGRGMFGEPNHDATRVQAALGPHLALAGFFAAGEIGPVAGTPHLHGFTASLALLRRRVRWDPGSGELG